MNPKNVGALIIEYFANIPDTEITEYEKYIANDFIEKLQDHQSSLEELSPFYEIEVEEGLVIADCETQLEERESSEQESESSSEDSVNESEDEYKESPEKKIPKRSILPNELEKAYIVYKQPKSGRRSFSSMNDKLPGIISNMNDYQTLQRY
jgi:hypothetical protein